MWDAEFEELLRNHLPYLPADESLTENTSLRDFGLDSMATVELLAQVESTYDVRFAEDDLTLETFATPGVLWKSLSAMRSS